MGGADFISNLPDSLQIAIVSLLPTIEGVRTSVLSRRWKTVWKHSSHLSFDQRKMLKHLIENYLLDASPYQRYVKAMQRKIFLRDDEDEDPIAEAAMLINMVVDAHFGGLKSCTIRHLPESCVSGEVEEWMTKLLEKGVKKVSMEREPDCMISLQQLSELQSFIRKTIQLPFDIFSGFEVLELKNYYLKISPSNNPSQVLKTLTLSDVSMEPIDFQNTISHCSSLENITLEKCHIWEVMIQSPTLKLFKIVNMFVSKIMVDAVNIEIIEIDTVFCDTKELVFKTPTLQFLRCSFDINKEGLDFSTMRDKLLTIKEIIEARNDNLVHQSSRIGNAFENLVTLMINLDLKILKNAKVLSSALRTCPKLENLEIISQVDADRDGAYNPNEDDGMQSFWQMEFSRGTCHHLKTLNIKGFIGKDFEVEFVKYIITDVETMEKITIWFVDSSTWVEATTTLCLLSFPKASTKLSITLKPGMKYMTKFGGSFQKWISTLKD